MYKKYILNILMFTGLVSFGFGVTVHAESEQTGSVDESVSQAIIDVLKAARPDLQYGPVGVSPIKDIYEVQVINGPVLYVAKNGRYFLDGDMYEIRAGRFVNLREQAMVGKRQQLLAELDVREMIVFPTVGPAKSVINVFTDVDCGYCRKLHKEVPDLNSRGIEVRYLAFPRAGVGSPSYDKLVSAWCSDTPAATLTELKNGGQVEANQCADNPVAAQYQMGQVMGVNGTPAIVLADGNMIPGYQPAADLARLLGLE